MFCPTIVKSHGSLSQEAQNVASELGNQRCLAMIMAASFSIEGFLLCSVSILFCYTIARTRSITLLLCSPAPAP